MKKVMCVKMTSIPIDDANYHEGSLNSSERDIVTLVMLRCSLNKPIDVHVCFVLARYSV